MKHPGDIRTHPLEDCPVCQELGDWASCEDSIEWIEAHAALGDLRESVEGPGVTSTDRRVWAMTRLRAGD